MDDAALAEVCREADVDIANLNCPGQTVISGDKDKIAKAVECEGAGSEAGDSVDWWPGLTFPADGWRQQKVAADWRSCRCVNHMCRSSPMSVRGPVVRWRRLKTC